MLWFAVFFLAVLPQTSVLEKAREAAQRYTSDLPNFVCTQTILRYEMDKGKNVWKAVDTLVLEVSYSEQGESFKLLTIDGKTTKKTLQDVGGVLSDGDFGTLLHWIFDSKSAATFRQEQDAPVNGRPAHVFAFSIDKAHSEYHVEFGKDYEGIFGWSGLIYVDSETYQVVRMAHNVDNVPPDWPASINRASLDYAVVAIDGSQTLLPARAEMVVQARNGKQFRNVMLFSNYQQFSSNTTVKFGQPK